MSNVAKFENLEFKAQNSSVILDVDGTIVVDGKDEINSAIIGKINEMKKSNAVFLCSNKPGMKERNNKLAKMLQIENICSRHSKPSRKILRDVPGLKDKRFIVIGDKFLTDGLFAKNISAEFIKTERITSTSDSFPVKLIYIADDLAYKIYLCLKLMRPRQWIKNIFIFVPIFFAKEFFSSDKLLTTFFAFIVFCFLASAIYIVNDIVDRRQDAAHPVKSKRPLAAGEVSLPGVLTMFGVLLFLSSVLTYLYVPKAAPALVTYLILNLLYTFYLKKVVIFDIIVIASFYLLRILAGGLATGTFISRWLVLCVIFLALFIIIGKRKSEFNREQADKREVLRYYNAGLLDHLQTISAALVIVSYGLYSVLGVSSSLAVYSTLLAVLAIYRYLYIVNSSGEAEYPEKLIVKDKVILGSFIGWLGFMFVIFYS